MGVGGVPRWAADAAAAGALALLMVGPALLHPDGVIGDGVDLYGTVWFYAWIHRCAAALADPSFTDLMFHPLGKDILAHTGDNFVDALVAAPLVAALGLLRGINLTIALILWTNALAMRAALGRAGLHPDLRLALSLAFALNPFATTELVAGRPTQALLAFTPLAVAGAARLGAAPLRAAPWLPVGIGVLVALQGWTYWFCGAFCAGAVAAVGLARAAAGGPARRRAALGGLVVAGASCLLLVAPGIIAVVRAGGGMGEASGGLLDLPRAVGNNVQQELYGLAHAEAHGLPVLLRAAPLLLGAFSLAGRRGRAWAALAAGAALLALGPRLPGGLVSLPYAVLTAVVPHWDRLWFPYRISVISVVALFLGAASSLGALRGGRARAAAALLLAVAAGDAARWGGLPLLWRPLEPPAALLALRARPGGLIELPIGLARESIAHQAFHGLPTFGGMGENAPFFWPDGHRQRLGHPLIRALRDPVRRPIPARGGSAAQLDRLRGWGMRYVVLDRQLLYAEINAQHAALPAPETARPRAATEAAAAAITAALGVPVGEDGPLLIWDLACIRPIAADLQPCAPLPSGAATGWGAPPARTAWEGLLEARGRLRAPPAPSPG